MAVAVFSCQLPLLLLPLFFRFYLSEECLNIVMIDFLKRKIGSLLLAFFLSANIFAQHSELSFDRLTIEDGLSENSVICIFQDSRGFLWFGSGDGLNRYDGYQFKVYKNDLADPQTIGSNYILAIHEDQQGEMWVGTWQGGLNRYNRATETFTRFTNDPADSNSLSDNSALSVLEDSNGTLWVGTIRKGLNRFDRELQTFRSYQHDPANPNSLSSNIVTVIQEGPEKTLWIGTGSKGLNRYDREKDSFVRYPVRTKNSPGLSHHAITAIVNDPLDNNVLWIATRGGGVNRFHIPTEKFQYYRNDPNNDASLSNNLVYSLFIDSQNQLWAGTFGGGLNRLSDDQTHFLNYRSDPGNPASLSDDKVISIAEDHARNLWFGTHKVGINKLNRQLNQFKHFYQRSDGNASGLCNNFITAIFEDGAGTLWVGTQGGLNRYDNTSGKFTYFLHDDNRPTSISHDWVSSIYEDSQGNFWVGTYGGGLNLLDRQTGTFRHFRSTLKDPTTIADNRVLSIAESGGYLWVAIRGGGLNRFDLSTEKFQRYLPDPEDDNSISDLAIRQVYPDRSGILWVAANNGLNRFDPTTEIFTHYAHAADSLNSLSDNRILFTFEDSRAHLWIGTMNGLNKFQRETNQFIRYTEREGLPNNVVYAALEDARGNLWLSTNRGLSHFNPQTESFMNYDHNDGLQSNEFNVGAAFQNAAGEMFFGGYNGLNVFHPDSIKANPNVPPVVITDFRVLNKSVKIAENSVLKESILETPQLNLSYHDKVFSFEFAALDFTASEKNQYAYMLEGFDEDWTHVGNRRFAGYTNLDPGNYRFRVKGANNSGIWNEEGTAIDIYIAPPFWMTWWFRFLAALSFLGLFALFYNNRISTLKKEKAAQEAFSKQLIAVQEQERKRIAGELHDSIGQDLLIIKNSLEISRKTEDQKALQGKLTELSEITAQTIGEVREISAHLHPHILERLGLTKAIQSMINKAFENTPTSVQVSLENIDGLFAKDQEINIYRMIQEGVNNLLKHAGATNAKIDVVRQNKEVAIRIGDDGKGFLPDNVSHNGFGLTGMAERVKFLDGSINLNSAPGQGTRLTITLPVK